MGLFGSKKEAEKRAVEILSTKALQAAHSVAMSGDLDDIFNAVVSQSRALFQCERASLALLSEVVAPGEGGWSLEVLAGEGKGMKINETDVDLVSSLHPGSFILSSDSAIDDVKVKTSALAYRQGTIMGCQSFKGRISLHKNPDSSRDLGNGKLTSLAIPLQFDSQATVVSERVKAGVLVLYEVPLKDELVAVIESYAALITLPLVLGRANKRDPLTNMHSEYALQGELAREVNLFEITRGKIKGGVVFGLVDNLTHYKKTIETETEVGADTAAQFVTDVIRGIGQCIAARNLHFPLDDGKVYRAGIPGRLGTNGFACLLPLLKEDEIVKFARALQADIREYNFPGENLLEEGEITISVRVMSFQDKDDKDLVWRRLRDEVSVIYRDQSQARGTERLSEVTSTLSIYTEKGVWLSFDDWKEYRRSRAAQDAQQQTPRPSGQRPPSRAGAGNRPAQQQRPTSSGRRPQGRPGPPPAVPRGGRGAAPRQPRRR